MLDTSLPGIEAALSTSPLVYLLGLGVLLLVLGVAMVLMLSRRSHRESAKGLTIVGVVMVIVSVFLAILPIPGING